MAVHIGARIGAMAGPGEVLASRTVRDLSAGSGLEFRRSRVTPAQRDTGRDQHLSRPRGLIYLPGDGNGRPAFPRGQHPDRRPVQIGAAVGEQGEEAVAQQAGDRQRHVEVLGGGEHEANVLLPKRRGETRRLELLVGDQRAVRLVHRAPNRVEVRMSRYWCLSTPPFATSAMASPRASTTDAIRKLPVSLTRLAAFGSVGHHKCALADRVEQPATPPLRPRRSPAATTNSLRGFAPHRDGRTRARRRNRCPARRAHAVNRSHSATLIVDDEMWMPPGFSDSQDAAVAERDGLDRRVVGQHREHHVGGAPPRPPSAPAPRRGRQRVDLSFDRL